MKYIQTAFTWASHNHRLILGILISGVLIAGGVYAASLGTVLRFLPDEADYVQLASNLVAQGHYSLDGVEPSAFRAPGYPLLLSVIWGLGGGIPLLRFGNYVLLAATLVLVYKILQTRSTPFAPLLGILLALAYPVLFFTAGTLYPQTLGAFLFLLSLFILLRGPLVRRSAIAAGLSLGALFLTIPTFLYTLILIPGWLWLSRRVTNFRNLILLVSIALGMIGLWTVRNALVFNAFVPLTTNTGRNLLYGNYEGTTPNAGTTVDISRYEMIAEELPEVARDRYYRTQAIKYIRENSPASIRMYFLKTLNFFNFSNRLETQGETTSVRDLAMLFSYGLLLGLTLLRLLTARVRPLTSFEIFLLIFYLLSAPIHALFFTRIRFRLPYDFALILLASLYLGEMINARFSRPGTQEK